MAEKKKSKKKEKNIPKDVDKKKLLKVQYICFSIACICYGLTLIVKTISVVFFDTAEFEVLDLVNICLTVTFGSLANDARIQYKNMK